MDNFGPRVIGLAHSGKVISPLGQRSSQRLRLEQKKATENREQNVDVHESVVSNVLRIVIPSMFFHFLNPLSLTRSLRKGCSFSHSEMLIK